MAYRKRSAADAAARAAALAAARHDYQHTMDTKAEIARRHGLTSDDLSRRIKAEHWYRLGEHRAMQAPEVSAIADMLNDIRRAMQSLLKRGDRLIERSEAEGSPLETQLALHERNVDGTGKLVRTLERFTVMLERCARSAVTLNATSQSLVDAYERIESRLAEEAERLEAEGYFAEDEPETSG